VEISTPVPPTQPATNSLRAAETPARGRRSAALRKSIYGKDEVQNNTYESDGAGFNQKYDVPVHKG
jgi:hypothetical protein